ncbi:hypothetical protein OPT61_g692 [Boeremia exigua]|uniref:Uncharacterized protein n=1 Tax=Boeremia exigua TaxID=749465 RepID=A0ACC2IT12_9PLEO|nr:hypothetical protein OPT61_g692 [Boeremia exigua]
MENLCQLLSNRADDALGDRFCGFRKFGHACVDAAALFMMHLIDGIVALWNSICDWFTRLFNKVLTFVISVRDTIISVITALINSTIEFTIHVRICCFLVCGWTAHQIRNGWMYVQERFTAGLKLCTEIATKLIQVSGPFWFLLPILALVYTASNFIDDLPMPSMDSNFSAESANQTSWSLSMPYRFDLFTESANETSLPLSVPQLAYRPDFTAVAILIVGLLFTPFLQNACTAIVMSIIELLRTGLRTLVEEIWPRLLAWFCTITTSPKVLRIALLVFASAFWWGGHQFVNISATWGTGTLPFNPLRLAFTCLEYAVLFCIESAHWLITLHKMLEPVTLADVERLWSAALQGIIYLLVIIAMSRVLYLYHLDAKMGIVEPEENPNDEDSESDESDNDSDDNGTDEEDSGSDEE